MGKEKIADSIIIRVGGGIREISRDPLEIAESQEAVNRESDKEQAEDVHAFGVKAKSNKNIVSDKTVN